MVTGNVFVTSGSEVTACVVVAGLTVPKGKPSGGRLKVTACALDKSQDGCQLF